jgi:alkylated DNA repair dioxygenase AlkB
MLIYHPNDIKNKRNLTNNMPRNENRRVSKPSRTKEGSHISEYDGRKDVHNLGTGDSYYISKFIKGSRNRDLIFQGLMNEVDFVSMYSFMENWTKVVPIPRMVSAQTCKDSKTSAIYRMPGCNQRNINTEHWTPNVKTVVDRASIEVDQKFNHCVCTLYRDENDSLAFHTDKTLDLEPDTKILSISFGAPRPFIFEEIDGKNRQTIMLQPGSIMVIGPKTNARYRHAIPKLKERTGPRISLSVRTISTEYNEETKEVVGQGAEFQKKNYPFITSYEDLGEYSDEVKKQIEVYNKEAETRLGCLRTLVTLD